MGPIQCFSAELHKVTQCTTKFRSIIFVLVIPGLFVALFSVFSNNHQFNFHNNFMWKISIEYLVQGFELMTFRFWISFLNHETGVPPLNIIFSSIKYLVQFSDTYFDQYFRVPRKFFLSSVMWSWKGKERKPIKEDEMDGVDKVSVA